MSKVKLSSLDKHVKQMMLNYPSIFPSRLECLHHLFCVNGNGYDWKDGIMVPWSRKKRLQTKTIELEKPSERMMQIIPEYETVRVEFVNTIRKFTEQNIDHLCRDIHHTNSRLTFIDVYPMSWDYCAMSYAADHRDEIDPDWQLGILQFIHWFLPRVNGHYMVYDSDGTKHADRIADPRVRQNYDLCLMVLDKIRSPEQKAHEQELADEIRKPVNPKAVV